MVTNAGWQPQYDLRLDSSSGRIELEFYASLRQSTGEDWKDVSLEVSTARPFYRPLPELKPWYVDIYKERPPVFYKSLEIRKGMAEALPEESVPELEEAEIKEEAASFSFIVPQRIEVLSDNQQRRVFLTSASPLKTDLHYSAIPKLSGFAYLTGEFINPFSFSLRKGKVNVFMDGRLSSTIELQKDFAPQENMKVSLGMDENVKIERRLVKRFTEYGGLLSKNMRVNYEYEINVTNGRARDIDINIKDHIPVSRNEQIKVNVEAPSRDEADISEEGIINWNLKLRPAEKRVLKIRFSVEYPEKLRIEGLE